MDAMCRHRTLPLIRSCAAALLGIRWTEAATFGRGRGSAFYMQRCNLEWLRQQYVSSSMHSM